MMYFGSWEAVRKLLVGIVLGCVEEPKANAGMIVTLFVIDTAIITFARPHVDMWKNITEIFVSVTRLANLGAIFALTIDAVDKPVLSNIFFLTSILGLVPLVINSVFDSVTAVIKTVVGLVSVTAVAPVSIIEGSVNDTLKAAKSGAVTAFYDDGMQGTEPSKEDDGNDKDEGLEVLVKGEDKELELGDFVELEDAKELRGSAKAGGAEPGTPGTSGNPKALGLKSTGLGLGSRDDAHDDSRSQEETRRNSPQASRDGAKEDVDDLIEELQLD